MRGPKGRDEEKCGLRAQTTQIPRRFEGNQSSHAMAEECIGVRRQRQDGLRRYGHERFESCEWGFVQSPSRPGSAAA